MRSQCFSTSARTGWTLERCQDYIKSDDDVVAGLRGVHPLLEATYDDVATKARGALARRSMPKSNDRAGPAQHIDTIERDAMRAELVDLMMKSRGEPFDRLRLRLIAVPKPGQEPWEMESVPWLQRPVPVLPAREREVYLVQGYYDFVLAVSADELRTWHARDRHLAFEGIFKYSSQRSGLDPMIAELERVLAAPDCPTFFVAHWVEDITEGLYDD
jgi:hypothetical protein